MKNDELIVLANPMSRGPRAAYIHIPFCKRKCGYCDFRSFAATPEDIDAYVTALSAEIRRMSELNAVFTQRERLDSLYIGGGTPSLLSPQQVNSLIVEIDRAFGLRDDCEITLEANPDSAESEKFLDYRAAGINRLSLGVQSLNDDLLRRLERLHDAKTAREAITKAKRSGFRNLSVDLMIGLPGQTFDDLTQDLEVLLREDIPHFSVYSLGIEENTPFYARYFQESQLGGLSDCESVANSESVAKPSTNDPLYAPLPSPSEERQMYHFCLEYMHEEGYRHYEVSNFAKEGYQSKHNQVYWRAEPYWGFGLAAASYIAGHRCTQTRDFSKYLDFFLQPQFAVSSTEDAPMFVVPKSLSELNPCLEEDLRVDRAEAMQEYFLLGLRLREGVSEAAFRLRFEEGIPFTLLEKLRRLSAEDLLVEGKASGAEGVAGSTWRLSRKGLDFGNEVFREFV